MLRCKGKMHLSSCAREVSSYDCAMQQQRHPRKTEFVFLPMDISVILTPPPFDSYRWKVPDISASGRHRINE